MTLPGILPPDAGRLERAARRYVIAVLSAGCVLRSEWHKEGHAANALEDACASMGLVEEAMREAAALRPTGDTRYEPGVRILRARVALYLRWCERVERMRYGTAARPLWPGSHGWHAAGYRLLPAGHDGFPVVAPVWAAPLWTLAPAHDPAVGPAARRKRKENR